VISVARNGFRESLADLRAAVVDMGELVLERLEDGLEALHTHDEDLARRVIEGDDEVNERYLALESECIELFALQQPVAGDLRFVAASFKIITDLERIGDLATNFGAYALAADRERLETVDVDGIGEDVADHVREAIAAYESGDPEACRRVVARDDEIDALCERATDRVVRDLVEREADGGTPWSVERLMDDVTRLLLTIRDLERVSDHAENVAARTNYATTGDDDLIY
jgi:phosphate transport system protein